MGRIYINTDAVYNLKSAMLARSKECRNCSWRIYSVTSNLYWKVLKRNEINAKLAELRKRVIRQGELLEEYAKALESVSDNLIETDNSLKGDAKKLAYQFGKISNVMSIYRSGTKRSKKVWSLNLDKYMFISSLFGGGTMGLAALSTKNYLHKVTEQDKKNGSE